MFLAKCGGNEARRTNQLFRNNGSGSMYIDGILEVTSSFSTNFNSIRNLYVGGLPNSGWGYFEGSISNVKIYNRALSSQEILQNYNALKGRFNL